MAAWEKRFEDVGAFWMHDGDPRRPYARLTSGLISNGFFNCGILVSEHPTLFAEAVQYLVNIADLPNGRDCFLRVVGAAKGAIILPFLIARYSEQAFAYAEKQEDELVFEERFSQHFANETFLLCEDTITTGGTVEKLARSVDTVLPGATFYDSVLAICNRSGLVEIGGKRIIALVDRPMLTWKEGENPFTVDGKELVEPVRPKTHWGALTRDYS